MRTLGVPSIALSSKFRGVATLPQCSKVNSMGYFGTPNIPKGRTWHRTYCGRGPRSTQSRLKKSFRKQGSTWFLPNPFSPSAEILFCSKLEFSYSSRPATRFPPPTATRKQSGFFRLSNRMAWHCCSTQCRKQAGAAGQCYEGKIPQYAHSDAVQRFCDDRCARGWLLALHGRLICLIDDDDRLLGPRNTWPIIVAGWERAAS